MKSVEADGILMMHRGKNLIFNNNFKQSLLEKGGLLNNFLHICLSSCILILMAFELTSQFPPSLMEVEITLQDTKIPQIS